ncbi:FGGY family of carbohydrate kinase [Mycena amicta]|nr:FGGY family of carbohydrate kinase [Mycena amicta]
MADNIELPVASSPFHDEGLPPPELLVARCLGLVTLAEYGSDDVQVSDVDSLFDEPDHIDFLTVALETASSPPAAGLSSPLAHKGTHCTPRPLGNSPLANVPTARKPGKPQPKLLSYGRSKAVQKVIMQAKIDRLEAHLKVTKEVLAQTVRTSAVAVSNAELELAFLRDATADNLAELKRFKLKFPQGCLWRRNNAAVRFNSFAPASALSVNPSNPMYYGKEVKIVEWNRNLKSNLRWIVYVTTSVKHQKEKDMHALLNIQEHADKCIQGAAGWAGDSDKVIESNPFHPPKVSPTSSAYVGWPRETAVAWSRKTGKPLCQAIVWTDSRTKNVVAHFEHKLAETGIEVSPDEWKDGPDALREITRLPLSTYFSAIKLRWMIDNHPEVAAAREADELASVPSNLGLYNLLGGASPTSISATSPTPPGPSCSTPKRCNGRSPSSRSSVSASPSCRNSHRRPMCMIALTRFPKIAYQAGPNPKPVYALEGSIAVAGSARQKSMTSQPKSNSGGLYFVTAFSGLLAPYWDPGAARILIGISQYTKPSHIARATLEANAYQTRAIVECMSLDAETDLKHLKVDGGMTNGDVAMQVLADVGGFTVVRPEMRESTALGSALLTVAAIGLFGWDLNNPESLAEVNTKGSRDFKPELAEPERRESSECLQHHVAIPALSPLVLTPGVFCEDI